MSLRVGVCVLACSLFACKGLDRLKGDDAPAASASAAAAVAPPVTSTPPPAAPPPAASVAAPEPAAPAEPPLAELFDGAPASELSERKKSEYGGRGTTVGIPKGWKLDMPNVAILVLSSPDKNAMLFAHDEIGAVTNGSVSFWSGRAGFAHKAKIEWEPELVDGKFGEKHGPVQIGLGKGTLDKKPATFWQIRFKKEGVLIAAALTDEAPAELKQELINAVRAVRPLEKGPQPYNPFG